VHQTIKYFFLSGKSRTICGVTRRYGVLALFSRCRKILWKWA